MGTVREERNRASLVEKARYLFFAEGFSRISMELAALKLGISKATLYKYFPNKERLLAAVVDLQMKIVSDSMDRLETGVPLFHDRFVQFLKTILETIRPAFPFFVRDLMENAPWEWKRIEEFRRRRIFSCLSDLLKDGAEFGFLRNDMSSDTIVPLLVTLIEQFGQPAVLVDLPLSTDEAFDAFIRILFQGILSDAGRDEFRSIGENFASAPGVDASRVKGTSLP